MSGKYTNCIDLSKDDSGKNICLRGWVSRRRDHGGIIFIDLRDYTGHCQIVINPQQEKAFALADQCRNEFVIEIQGSIIDRPEGMTNEALVTGDIEIEVSEFVIVNTATPPIFPVNDDNASVMSNEDIRLKNRYLDMRRAPMQHNILLRSKLAKSIRKHLDSQDFAELETPLLTVSSPEGAREFLVPSRMNANCFYALTQSPQVFKQIFMAGGFEKYYQICRCFRDEDLRHDRQPEFTQLDIEMAWPENEQTIIKLATDLTVNVFREVADIDLGPIGTMTYATAMQTYGIDKPDLRYPSKFIDVHDIFANESFKVFAQPAKQLDFNRVTVIVLKNAEGITRSEIDEYTKLAQSKGAGGLAWIRAKSGTNREGLQSPFIKFISDQALEQLVDRTELELGDLMFFGAGETSIVNSVLSELRVVVNQRLGNTLSNWACSWITDFPLTQMNSQGRLAASHNPFTQPRHDDWQENSQQAGSLTYDLVINGYEVAGGSVRNHDAELQKTFFEHIGLSSDEIEQRFGYLLRALASGCPPHGGIAFGFDRMMMLLCNENIRNVIAFPKTQIGSDLLTGAPTTVHKEQLDELGLQSIPK